MNELCKIIRDMVILLRCALLEMGLPRAAFRG